MRQGTEQAAFRFFRGSTAFIHHFLIIRSHGGVILVKAHVRNQRNFGGTANETGPTPGTCGSLSSPSRTACGGDHPTIVRLGQCTYGRG